MASDSLKHEARTRQSHSEIPETLNNKAPDSGAFGHIPRSMTFSLTFTFPHWCLFWRLLNVGCMLADEVLDLAESPKKKAEPDAALLWNRLSSELAALLQKNEVQQQRKESQKTTR